MKTKTNTKNYSAKTFMILCMLLSFAFPAYAHKVYLFAWTEGDMIHTESYFGGNKKVQDGTIKVFNMEGKELLSGKTNGAGEFSFRIPEIEDLRIVLESSMGHGAEYIFKKSEFSAGQAPVTEDVPGNKIGSNEPRAAVQGRGVDDQVRKEIEASLDSKLKPIIRELALLREERGPGVTEIIGGIGYIFGIMGIIAYMKSKKKQG